MNFGHNGFYRGRPHEGFWRSIVVRDVRFNRLNQLRDAAEHPTADSFGCELSEEAFHQIEPGTARGREMHMEPGMPLQPRLDRGVFVRGIVIHDEMQRFVFGGLPIN